ncbi:general transcription factor IIH component [Dictyostelium discoideum AX4]|uniref:General transcription factor IIH subunit 1 n=1 Tax=Dictyostelium discoideum TaxID=44689 RepID=TF2H1_DICDI|nr:general transcription factor IIH component [Dictyostelium discoideum AX4]Q55FP1.1 RecName: Full=General transcription factor IIH subunit 1; AltName: Full=TFIIH basal transcription factor complex subunit 1 [Dictyostelium discoideum]EAL73460.1 general transcription factor IIH component [Dictyostelium discoideum AX4]|eukprot:XP_647492.1 general transcription factor IIH component [Dictyostelium discoideum AX4]
MNKFSREAGEVVLLRAITKYSSQQGTLFFTSLRLVWVQSGYSEPSLHLHISEIKNQFISTPKSAKALLRLSVRDSIKNALQEFVFEFTHPTNARSDLNSFRDKIAATANLTAPTLPVSASNGSNTTSPTNGTSPINGTSPTMTGLKVNPDGTITNDPLSSQPAQVEEKAETKYLSKLKQPSLSEQQIKQRVILLQSNKELRELYEQMVNKDRVISESDFWESRKSMLKNDSTRSEKQHTGMPSNLLADVRPSSETPNAVHYRFTPTVIHQIFIQHPSVEKAYKANVPLKISEQNFWKKYVQSKYFYRDRSSANAPPVDDDLFSKYETDEQNKIRILKRKLIDINPLVDLSSTDGFDTDVHSGYGVLLDQSQDPNKLEKALPLLRKFNRHSALVLGSKDLLTNNSINIEKDQKNLKKTKKDENSTSTPTTTTTTTNTTNTTNTTTTTTTNNTTIKDPNLYNGDDEENISVEQMEKILENHKKLVNQHIIIDDLQEENSQTLTLLKISDQKRYFEGHSTNNILSDKEKSQLIDILDFDYKNWQPNLPQVFYQTHSSSSILQEPNISVHSEIFEPYNKAAINSKEEYNLPESSFKRDLFQSFHHCNELLRHFWATTFTLGRGAPPTSQQIDKNNKISSAIALQYDKIEEKKKMLISQNKVNQSSLFTPILESLHKAIEKKESQTNQYTFKNNNNNFHTIS